MNILLLYPIFPPSHWSYETVLKLIKRKALFPPLNLITVAAILPQDWEYRLVDCNTREITEADWAWADMVLLTGMIVQKPHLLALVREAKQRGKVSVVGGPYVTSEPDETLAAGVDFLVLDEGEITIPLFVEALQRGETSGVFRANGEKPDMHLTPIPRYDLLNFDDYNDMSMQFSRGCPFLCEFCDIIILYGRKPRTKTSEQIIAEMQYLYDLGWRHYLFMVDDNFIGNKRALKPVLEAIADWQKAHDYPFLLSTEASVNLADEPELMRLMAAANFRSVFLGIETPDIDSLMLTKKKQNTKKPLVEQVKTISNHGIRTLGGFIIGFDNEKPGADQRILEFVNESGIAFAIVTMLQALPTTHLTQRLQTEGRMRKATDRVASNQTSLINFVATRPTREIAREQAACYWELYEPRNFIRRTLQHCLNLNVDARPKASRKSRPIRSREVMLILTLLWRHGIKRSSRGVFWQALWHVLRHKPGTLMIFIECCVAFEHFYVYRQTIRDDIESQLAQLSEEERERVVSLA